VPLEFLRRKGNETRASKAAAPLPVAAQPVPEEAVAQDHQLRLSYAAKTSTGVRLQGGPNVMNTLGHMLDGLATSDVEVVPPREATLTVASPHIIHTQEAGEWLRAHGDASPITRHALYVLELLDAIDPAYDTFASALLDGDVDTSGYPEYSSIVGGVAAHWDEATGDLIVRGVVGWGGRGTRGDTDRTANRLLGRLLTLVDDNDRTGHSRVNCTGIRELARFIEREAETLARRQPPRVERSIIRRRRIEHDHTVGDDELPGVSVSRSSP